MAIRLANRRFAPSLVGTVLAIVGVVSFVQLGAWQLRRAEQKEALQHAYAAGQESTVELTAQNVEALPRYQRVETRGHYLPERQVLLDNMPSEQGRPGFRVLTPFELSEGGYVLVDRGWIPMNDREIDPSTLEVDRSARTVRGVLDELPRPGLRLSDGREQAPTAWPRIMNFPEQDELESALEMPLARRIVLLDPNEPDGFERQWRTPQAFGPERHIGYAIQWFAFALVAVVLYIVMSFRRETR